MNSRFVNLAVRHMKGPRAPFSLYRINSASLFYPTAPTTTIKEGSADPATKEKSRLPSAAISFDWPCQKVQSGWMNFMSIGSSGNAIVVVDNVGRTILYDAELQTIRNSLPMMSNPISDPISVAIGDDLYVMQVKPGPSPRMGCFQALLQSSKSESLKTWHWHSLQPPPFARAHVNRYPNCSNDNYDVVSEEVEDAFEICSYTLVGDSQIWISTMGAGTYSFDIKSGAWNKAGDWMLPFRGRAEYVAEHNLWFGFSHDYQQLCAFDMTVVSEARQHVLPIAWNDMVWPKSWIPSGAHLVPLGSGKFCIARFFCTLEEKLLRYASGLDYRNMATSNFAVLAGIQVECGGKPDNIYDIEGLRMVKHKSKRYIFGCNVAWFL